MKTFYSFVILLLMAGSILKTEAAPEKKTIVFKVYGNCGMCKKKIETALDIKGVKSAVWNVESKMIEVVYQPEVISETKIHEAIALSGYDTEKIKASDEDYNRLHTCCQYRKE